jgi:hypothetical protein
MIGRGGYVRRTSGTYRQGRIELDEPVDWRDGVRVSIVSDAEGIGIDESEWPTDSEAIRAHLARLDAIEPLELTPEDEAATAAARSAVREASIQAVRLKMGT